MKKASMNDLIERRKLQKLGKTELLELIEDLAGELQTLETENRRLRDQAENRPGGDLGEQHEQLLQIARSIGRLGDMAKKVEQEMDDYLTGARLRARHRREAPENEEVTRKMLGSVSELQRALEKSSG